MCLQENGVQYRAGFMTLELSFQRVSNLVEEKKSGPKNQQQPDQTVLNE